MDKIIDVFFLGYFDAINDALVSNLAKRFKLDINNNFKSILYDIGYSSGYQECFTYLKNSL